LSDGESRMISVTRPFYALDTPLGGRHQDLAGRSPRFQFKDGSAFAKYRHRQQSADTFGGWSRGLVGGWCNVTRSA